VVYLHSETVREKARERKRAQRARDRERAARGEREAARLLRHEEERNDPTVAERREKEREKARERKRAQRARDAEKRNTQEPSMAPAPAPAPPADPMSIPGGVFFGPGLTVL
jgi:hypothetical protein